MLSKTGSPCQAGKKSSRKVWSVAPPEDAGPVEMGEHPMEGPGVRAGGEDAGIQPAEVGERLVDVGGRGELGVVEEAVDILQDKRCQRRGKTARA